MAAASDMSKVSTIINQIKSGKYHVSDASKIVSADLLAADSRIPQLLCFAVQAAANKLTAGPDDAFIGKGICISSVGEPYGKGRSEFATVDKTGTIAYYPGDLMIIGGMAIALYDYVIRDIKQSRGLPSLKNSLTKNTSDIDMVWWPRMPSSKEIITIHSPGIKQLRDLFIKKIKHEMNTTFRIKKVEKMILHITNAKSFITYVTFKNSFIHGAIHIHIYFIITYENGNTEVLEMCDIAIHDSGSSQLNNKYQLEFMTEDPVYCDPFTQINKLPVNPPFYCNVPIIEKIVKQQILAYENLLEENSGKSKIIYNRLRYIRSLLAPTNAHRPALLKVFGISNEGVSEAIDNINQIVSKEETRRNSVLHDYDILSMYHHFQGLPPDMQQPYIYYMMQQNPQITQQFIQTYMPQYMPYYFPQLYFPQYVPQYGTQPLQAMSQSRRKQQSQSHSIPPLHPRPASYINPPGSKGGRHTRRKRKPRKTAKCR